VIPSLVAGEMREAIVEFLTTTFALNDDETRTALAEFLAGEPDGIFRGPFLRVRTPFRLIDEGWEAPLDWLPPGFRPYVHQARAFERLSSRDQSPHPTIVTTGTGSGKTEAFLFPILDHCRRQRANGVPGVKALLLYPMNALATDQARRLARLLHGDPDLAGVTAGLYIGGTGSRTTPGPDHLIDDRTTLKRSPPDILLTNYKMLDFLLLRREDRELWVAGPPGTLRYVVLDELHTYDGAQGTDVAMLLRRLGATSLMAEPGRPLGPATPVATSATLGSGVQAGIDLRDFAERVFGVPFPEEAVVGEVRQTPDEACDRVDYTLPIPEVSDVLAIPADDIDRVTAVFTGHTEPLDPVGLGAVLLRHPLTRAVLAAASDRPRRWAEAVDHVVTRAPTWGAVNQNNPTAVHAALASYLGLLSVARRLEGGTRPLFAIEVQVWVREVSRLLRSVQAVPRFRWFDSARAEEGDPLDSQEQRVPQLPAVYCRQCGRAGWMSSKAELDGVLVFRPALVYQQSVAAPALLRTLLRADPAEPDARHLEPASGHLVSEPTHTSLPVIVTPSEEEATRLVCPSCGYRDAIRFLGSHVASLASVCITQLFGSNLVHAEERKLLAFTDSVQDASHRAAFFAGRTYRFNLRTLLAGITSDQGHLDLADVGPRLVEEAGDPGGVHALVPPDLLTHPLVVTLWTATPNPDGRTLLARRLGFEAILEVGLRARLGRTLELTRTVAAAVDADLPALVAMVDEVHRHLTGQPLPGGLHIAEAWLRGLLERLRLRGGVFHQWLDAYVRESGNAWRLWGGRPDGMPPFPTGLSRPIFLTTAKPNPFDSITSSSRTPSWMIDWASRTLGVDAGTARDLSGRVLALLASEDVVESRTTTRGETIYGLSPQRIGVWDVPDEDGRPAPCTLRCELCRSRHVAPPERLRDWIGTPCLRYRCPGSYEEAPPEPTNYYRGLYRSKSIRRVVTAEHTGLLHRPERERLESLFKKGTDPVAPNVVTCTPTLELGIDIGELSTVLLTSVPRNPASYAQRVGRAGRLTGNAFIAAFLPTEARSLYYLAQPEHMLAGEVRPPSCYLDAIEILRRQYLAYLLDRGAAGELDAPPMPRKAGSVMVNGLASGGWLRAILDISILDPDHIRAFCSLFGSHLRSETIEALREFAAGGLEVAVKEAAESWNERYQELGRRRDRLKTAIERAQGLPYLEEEDERDLRRLRGERHAVIETLRELREDYTLTTLEAVGLLPNYTLIDDAVTLSAVLWSYDDKGERSIESFEYQRPAVLALTEFAPGNSFYVRGHKLPIDALDIGSANEPLYEWWRLCPECPFGGPESGVAAWSVCPRCGSSAIADAGARHLLLRLTHVSSSDSEERTRVLDETDERDRRFYQLVTTVDVQPVDVAAAWAHRTEAFGMELARDATIRSFNLGQSGRAGERVRIGGADRTAPRFITCRYCGAVDGARGGGVEHRGWCLVRSGARSETWDQPVLYHEIRTEVIRLLLPVSTFEVDERLASFKGALLLGLRLDFGGDPEHLAVTVSDLPGSGGPGRRRFLVLYDTVPGGTGYLGRVADPERLRGILEKSREGISRCPCRDEGRVACHRCLLGAVAPREIELVSRSLALELLDQLLEQWAFDPVATVAQADIGAVEESELERRFRVALRVWAGRPDNGDSVAIRPGTGRRDALELRLSDGESTRRWLVEEQRPLNTTPATTPDYLITRQDESALQVAVYLDGFQFHASVEHQRLADDAAKRHAARASRRLVWSLTWDDVDAFHQAAESDVPKIPADRPLLPTAARHVARQVHLAQALGVPDLALVDRNPMRQLIEFLRRPDLAGWERAALATVAGLASAGRRESAQRDEVRPLLIKLLEGDGGSTQAADDKGPLLVSRWRSPNGLLLAGVLDGRPDVGGPNAERWTAVALLDDRPDALEEIAHHYRWRDWLQWGNLLQFLWGPGRAALITTISGADWVDLGDLDVVPVGVATAEEPETVGGTSQGVGLSTEAIEEMELVLNDDARALSEAVLRRGGSVPVAGYEPEDGEDQGWVVEVAWPKARVGILSGEDVARDSWLAAHGWDARPPERWTPEDLLAAVEESTR
jgi:ATP-dependent helicase YprA (DUF1998 family)